MDIVRRLFCVLSQGGHLSLIKVFFNFRFITNVLLFSSSYGLIHVPLLVRPLKKRIHVIHVIRQQGNCIYQEKTSDLLSNMHNSPVNEDNRKIFARVFARGAEQKLKLCCLCLD